MDYEKKYNEALERARANYKADKEMGFLENCDMLELIFPELCESEDERIRKGMIRFLESEQAEGIFTYEARMSWIAYLEKQKEQKPADFPVTDEEVKEFLETHQKVEVPEKYKTPDFVFSKQDYSGLTDLERAIHRGFLSAGVENVPVIIIKETAQDCLAQMKPVEWSEEDEVYLQDALLCVEQAAKVARGVNDMGACWSAERWLKSLRPRSKEELAKMLQDEYNKGKEEGERIGHTKGYNKGYKDAEEAYNKAVSYHQ